MEQGQKHILMDDDNSLREVWFYIEKDHDGYPESRTWEGLWTRKTNEGLEVLSVPFYLKNVCRGDIVQAVENQFLQFSEVRSRGGHNTYRLLLEDSLKDTASDVANELLAKGLVVEINETGILIAVDVPPTVNQQEIDGYLLNGKASGRWQLQDGYLNNVIMGE